MEMSLWVLAEIFKEAVSFFHLKLIDGGGETQLTARYITQESK